MGVYMAVKLVMVIKLGVCGWRVWRGLVAGVSNSAG